MTDWRLTGLFDLRAPLSHIGETIGTTAYLAEEPIRQPDGSYLDVFCYAGNAWRGQLRDLASLYLLHRLDNPRLPLDTFHLLFSGGRIGGDMVVDLDRARQYRQAIPLVALWGGGVGNQILPGKLRVANSYPLCHEALSALPARYRPLVTSTYRDMTFEKSFSRTDDGKNPAYDRFRALPAPVQGALLAGDDGAAPTPAKPKRDGPADQMRMTVELVAVGTQLATEITLRDASEVELGCLTSALYTFARSPHIGGQASRGHGAVSLAYTVRDLDRGEEERFFICDGDTPVLFPPAEAALHAYDAHVLRLYQEMLVEQGGTIRGLLGVAS
ncbi:MAG: hypothetical protein AB7R89_16105 [Dehalococcoidia bacterium]